MNETRLSQLTRKQTEKLSLEYLKYWQKRLRLQDWDIRIEVDNDIENCSGQVTKSLDYQWAKILIKDPTKLPEDRYLVEDLEVTIVHELLHIRMAYITGKKANHHEEMAIETIAQNLVALKRGIEVEDLV